MFSSGQGLPAALALQRSRFISSPSGKNQLSTKICILLYLRNNLQLPRHGRACMCGLYQDSLYLTSSAATSSSLALEAMPYSVRPSLTRYMRLRLRRNAGKHVLPVERGKCSPPNKRALLDDYSPPDDKHRRGSAPLAAR